MAPSAQANPAQPDSTTKKQPMGSKLLLVGFTLLLAMGWQQACTRSSSPSTHAQALETRAGKPLLDVALQEWLLTSPKRADAVAAAYRIESIRTPTGQEQVGLWVLRKPQQSWPTIPGLTWYTKRGIFATARATRAALQELSQLSAIHGIEASIRLEPARDLGNSSTLAHSSSFDSKAPPTSHERTYALTPSALTASGTATVVVRVYAAYNSNNKRPELLPSVQLCADSSCSQVLDRDIGDYSATLPTGLIDPRPTPHSHARLSYTFVPNGLRTLTIKLTGLAVADDGQYTLVVSSESLAFSSGDLSGGDITPTQQARLMGNESAQARTNHQVTGKGALVGIIDTGIDWCHPDFIDQTGQSRILMLWDQTITPRAGDTSPDVGNDGDTSNDYGVLYSQSQITAALKTCDKSSIRSLDTSGHGTHVAGIAAGGGSLPGIAPEAGLVIVKYTFFSSQQPDAISFLLNEAKRRKMGIAINMSLGTQAGPKDGSSAQERFLTSVVGPGRNIVVSAGNAGASAIHAQGTIKIGDSTDIKFAYNKSSSYTGGTIDLYTHLDDEYELTLQAPDGIRYSVHWGQRNSWSTSDYQVYLTAGTTRQGQLRVSSFGAVYTNPTAQTDAWSLQLTRPHGTGNGKFDAYIASTSSNIRFQSHALRNANGSYIGTLGSPSTAPGAFTVASYSMRYVFDALQEPQTFYANYKTFGALATSSSRGPTGDGRPGVDLGAPGQYVLSSQSSLRAQDRSTLFNPLHRAISGTSMSAPMVTGAAALVLQKHPTVFVRPLFKQHALTPGCCPTPDTNQWGAGMLTLRGVFEALATATPPTLTLATKDGVLQKMTPFTTTLVATSPDKIVEYHWDLDGDGGTDQITATPEITTTLTQGGSPTLRVTAYTATGQSATATIALIAIGPPPEPIAESNPEPAPEPTHGIDGSENADSSGQHDSVVENDSSDKGEQAPQPTADAAANESSEANTETSGEGHIEQPQTPEIAVDARPEPIQPKPDESSSEPPQNPVPDTAPKEAQSTEPDGLSETGPKPPDGCGCSSTMGQRPPASGVLWLLLCTMLFGWRRRR